MAGSLLAACATTYYVPRGAGRLQGMASVSENLSDKGLARLTADMDPAMLALARRHDPHHGPDLWGRPEGGQASTSARRPTWALVRRWTLSPRTSTPCGRSPPCRSGR
uniref:Uncharacterized protein n=1 Tax=Phenylobacterium glaciei TaxID=2803784 RepID=A0A974P342_9CAUL|nr:hypothetical protein JKL49_21345 [Phenylobacterium glaciei]